MNFLSGLTSEGALKGLSSKAEEMIEKTKTSVGEMAAEKKAAAAALIEAQASKTKDVLFQTKSNVEGEIVDGANEAKAAAIEGFDKELSNVEQSVDQGVQEIKPTNAEAPPSGAGAAFNPAALASSALSGGLGNVEKEAEKAVEGALKQVSQAVDTKIKETDQYLDQKRDEVVKTVQDESQKATAGVTEQLGSVLGKAKGLLNF